VPYYIGVDVGGTTSTIAVGSPNHEVQFISPQFTTRSSEGPIATVEDIVQQILRYLTTRSADATEIAGVSLATPGPATRDGVLLKTPNLDPRLWNRCPIRKMLQTALVQHGCSVPVSYIGDGQAAALGEFAVRKHALAWPEIWQATLDGSRPDFDTANLESLFMVAVGTGLGGGEVRDGQVIRGQQGRAGHAGHIFLPYDAFRYPEEREFKVGNAVSTLESAVSLTALTHQLSHRLTLPQWADHPLHRVSGTMKDQAKQLRELAAQGDALASELFDDQARALGIGMLQVNYIGDYDLLVIGGGVCDLAPALRTRYLELAHAAYREHALDGFRNLEGFAFSICGDRSSVIGALRQAYES